MALPQKNLYCAICSRIGSTDYHHIISQHHARKTGQYSLINNPRNVVELCRQCHNQTTASLVRRWFERGNRTMRSQYLFSGNEKNLPGKQKKITDREYYRTERLIR